MSDKPPLPPGILPNIFDTDPPPMHPATEVGDGYVRVNEEKLAEQSKKPATRDDPEAHPNHPEHHSWLERMGHQGRERAASYAQERAGKH